MSGARYRSATTVSELHEHLVGDTHLQVMIEAAIARDFQLGPGAEGCALLLGGADGFEDAVAIPQEVQGNAGQRCRSNSHNFHDVFAACEETNVVF